MGEMNQRHRIHGSEYLESQQGPGGPDVEKTQQHQKKQAQPGIKAGKRHLIHQIKLILRIEISFALALRLSLIFLQSSLLQMTSPHPLLQMLLIGRGIRGRWSIMHDLNRVLPVGGKRAMERTERFGLQCSSSSSPFADAWPSAWQARRSPIS